MTINISAVSAPPIQTPRPPINPLKDSIKLLSHHTNNVTGAVDTVAMAKDLASQQKPLAEIKLQVSVISDLMAHKHVRPIEITQFKIQVENEIDKISEKVSTITQDFKEKITQLAQEPAQFHENFQTTFGSNYAETNIESLRQQILDNDFSFIPRIQFTDGITLHGHAGAYEAETSTIYLNESLSEELSNQTFIEEMGHHLDNIVNEVDSVGDEGAIFRTLLSDNPTINQILELQQKNDHGSINFDNQSRSVEFAGLTIDLEAETNIAIGDIVFLDRGNTSIQYWGSGPNQQMTINYNGMVFGDTDFIDAQLSNGYLAESSVIVDSNALQTDITRLGAIPSAGMSGTLIPAEYAAQYPAIQLGQNIDHYYNPSNGRSGTTITHENGSTETHRYNEGNLAGSEASTTVTVREDRPSTTPQITPRPSEHEGAFVVDGRTNEIDWNSSTLGLSTIHRRFDGNAYFLSNEDFIQQAHIKLLGREPDASSQPLLDALNQNNTTQNAVYRSLLNGDERKLIASERINTELLYFVNNQATPSLRNAILAKSPFPNEHIGIDNPILSGSQGGSNERFAERVYQALFDREPSVEEQTSYRGMLDGSSKVEILQHIYNEFVQKANAYNKAQEIERGLLKGNYDENGNVIIDFDGYESGHNSDTSQLSVISDEAVLNAAYENYFGRSITDSEKTYYLEKLESGAISQRDLIKHLRNNPEHLEHYLKENADPMLQAHFPEGHKIYNDNLHPFALVDTVFNELIGPTPENKQEVLGLKGVFQSMVAIGVLDRVSLVEAVFNTPMYQGLLSERSNLVERDGLNINRNEDGSLNVTWSEESIDELGNRMTTTTILNWRDENSFTLNSITEPTEGLLTGQPEETLPPGYNNLDLPPPIPPQLTTLSPESDTASEPISESGFDKAADFASALGPAVAEGFDQARREFATDIVDFIFDYKEGGFYNTAPGETATKTGEWISSEIYELINGDPANTETAALLEHVGNFASDWWDNKGNTLTSAQEYWGDVATSVGNYIENTEGSVLGNQVGHVLGAELFAAALTRRIGSSINMIENIPNNISTITDRLATGGRNADIQDWLDEAYKRGDFDHLTLDPPETDLLEGGARAGGRGYTIELDEQGKFNGQLNAGPNTPKFNEWINDKGGTVKFDDTTGIYTYGRQIETSHEGNRFIEVEYKPGMPDGSTYPDFSNYSAEVVEIENMTGKPEASLNKGEIGDFSKAWEALAKQHGDEYIENTYGIKRRDHGDRAGTFPDLSPRGYTWHHSEDTKSLLLVDQNIHAEFPHVGGASISRN